VSLSSATSADCSELMPAIRPKTSTVPTTASSAETTNPRSSVQNCANNDFMGLSRFFCDMCQRSGVVTKGRPSASRKQPNAGWFKPPQATLRDVAVRGELRIPRWRTIRRTTRLAFFPPGCSAITSRRGLSGRSRLPSFPTVSDTREKLGGLSGRHTRLHRIIKHIACHQRTRQHQTKRIIRHNHLAP
jgi:hypothetical protein